LGANGSIGGTAMIDDGSGLGLSAIGNPPRFNRL
jgi:hypothetical protein